MSEKPPKLEENKDASEFLTLALELSEGRERYDFPGIDDDSYRILKDEQKGIPQDYILDIDAFTSELAEGGMRIVLEKGQVYVCTHGDDSKNHAVDTVRYFFPRHLNPHTITDSKLKKLVELSKIHPLV